MPPRPISDDQLQASLTRAIEDAVGFVSSEIAPDREKALRYMRGETDLGEEEGRSKVVATKARDTVRAVLPVLMRIFLQSGRPVEFTPNHPAAVQAAEQQTAYVESVFDRERGFITLHSAFTDALVAKNGIVHVAFCTSPEVEFDNYTGLDEMTAQMVLAQNDPDLEVLEYVQEPDGTLSLKVAKTQRKGRIRITPVPPETFFVDAGAKSVDDFGVIGHSNPDARVGDLVAMGFDFDQVIDLAGDETSADGDGEEQERTGRSSDDDEAGADPSMRKVRFTEAYMRCDRDGTGIPRLHKFLCAGSNYTILRDEAGELAIEPADQGPYCNFLVDPIPHTFFGRSLVDIITEDQDAATSLLRGLIDSIHFTVNPRTVILADSVDEESILNSEYGAIWRERVPGAIREMPLGTAGALALPAIEYFDGTIRSKTGVSDAAMGMGPDALRNTTATAADGILGAAQAVAELIARVLAETGMTDLARKVAALARQHPNPEEMVQINGQFAPVDPRSWVSGLAVKVNVGLGTGRAEDRVQGLLEVIQAQAQAYQMLGPGNPVVGLTEMRNAQADLLAARGLHNSDRYWKPMSAEMEQQMLEQQAQAAQGQGQQDPAAQAMIGAEQVKGQTALQIKQMDLAAKAVIEAAKDDLARDKMAQDLALAQVAQAQKVNESRLRAEQAATRPFGPQAAPQGQPPAR